MQTVNVPRPVVMACVRYEDIPAAPTPPAVAPNADIEQRAAWALLRDEQLRQYAAQLRAIAIACSTSEVHQ